jgi:ferrous iron transport protein B
MAMAKDQGEGRSPRSGYSDSKPRLILVGNPNVGKSVIFGHLTGRYVTVSNYPGTTVEVSRGETSLGGKRFEVLDTPGVNNLIPLSEEERVTRDMLLDEDYQVILQVADAKNLRRSLLLTLQLAEMKVPFLLDLNLMDEAQERGIQIDIQRLSQILGIEVISTVATQKKGMERLVHSLSHAHPSSFEFQYSPIIEEGIRRMEPHLPKSRLSRRSLSLMALAGDLSLMKWLRGHPSPESAARVLEIREEIAGRYSQPLGYVIDRERLQETGRLLTQVMASRRGESRAFSALLERYSVHSIGGIPFLLLILLFAYGFVGFLGAQVLVGFLEEVLFGRFLNPWAARLTSLLPWPILRDFLVGPYGLFTMALNYAVAIVLPIVGTFFIFFGLLEDSGYLPRLAVMVNRMMRIMGLSGKAVLPLVLGLGCDTMATLTTRILETEKDRILTTLLLSLAIPCSAQLGVILGMLGSLSFHATLIWAGTILGVMILVGYLASKIIPGATSDFIMDLPPLRIPQLSNILIKTVARIEWYLKEAVPLFIVGTSFLFVLDKLGFLRLIEIWASPLVVWGLGLPARATEAFIVGFLRRDYGAAGLYMLARAGQMDHIQILVSLVTMTLFVPCIAQFLVSIKERGWKATALMISFIFPFAFLVGAILNFLLRRLGVSL